MLSRRSAARMRLRDLAFVGVDNLTLLRLRSSNNLLLTRLEEGDPMTEHSVVASVHLADLGPRRIFTVLRKAPSPRSIDGLRQANVALAAPLKASGPPLPPLRRVGLI